MSKKVKATKKAIRPWVIETANGYTFTLKVESDLNHPKFKYLYLEAETPDGENYIAELEPRDALRLANALLDAEDQMQPTDF